MAYQHDFKLEKIGHRNRVYRAGYEIQKHDGYWMVLPTINGSVNMTIARTFRNDDDNWVVPFSGRKYLAKSVEEIIDDLVFRIALHFEKAGYNHAA